MGDEHDPEKCLRQRDVLFTRRLITWSIVAFVVAMVIYVWTVHIDNFIDDQIMMYDKDCHPESNRAQEMMMEECSKAKVYAESTRGLAYLMFCFYFVTDGASHFFDWFLTNMTYIGSTVFATALGLGVKRYLLPGFF